MLCLFRLIYALTEVHSGETALSIRFFDAHGRKLLGAVHLPTRLRARSVAVLLCNPFGEEAARAHRAYRVMARKFEEAGYAAMRFDYSGTGDSSGEITDVGVDIWLDDIAAAAEELRRESGSSRIVLVGLRFGATLAALCAQRGTFRAAHTLLWDPVVDGTRYLRELGDAHDAYMDAEMGRQSPVKNRIGGELPAVELTEVLGTPISAALHAQLAAIDLARDTPPTNMTTILCTQPTPDLQRLRAHWSEASRLHWIDLAGSDAWNSDAALNNAIVPMHEILAVISRIEACHP